MTVEGCDVRASSRSGFPHLAALRPSVPAAASNILGRSPTWWARAGPAPPAPPDATAGRVTLSLTLALITLTLNPTPNSKPKPNPKPKA